MRKLNFFFLSLIVVFISNTVKAQSIIFNESLATHQSFNKFTPVSVIGDRVWYYNTAYGCAHMSGYVVQPYENEDWLVSPEINLENYTNLTLSFDHTRGSANVLNVGLAEGWYKVFATSNYTGNVNTTQWTELSGINHNVITAWQWISSGEVTIPEEVKSTTTRFAFRYICSDTESATWEVKNVKIKGTPNQVNPNDDVVFKITTWNVEYLGSVCDGPGNEDLQMSNVANAILAMNPDIICLQEVTHSNNYPTITNLIALLGSDVWGGNIIASNPSDCSQNQGIIYKKSKVQFVNSSLLSNGNSSQGNSYYYNWSNGRYPALYNVNLIVGSQLVPVSLVNIHAKAFNDESSYTRRKGASQGLKTILDGTQYNSKNLIILGDFNDYLNGTICNQCNTNDSPYQNFVEDYNNYSAPTKYLENEGCIYKPYVIDNIITSNELFENYISDSAEQELAVFYDTANYCQTTSSHIPVSSLFEFTPTASIDDFYSQNSLKIYPNPTTDFINIENFNSINIDNFEIYNLLGEKVMDEKLSDKAINVSRLAKGIYILKVGEYVTKFSKN